MIISKEKELIKWREKRADRKRSTVKIGLQMNEANER